MLATPIVPAAAILRIGSAGPAVTALQTALAVAGYEAPGSIDGRFGPLTEAMLAAYQSNQNLVIDGVAGRETLAALATSASMTAAWTSATAAHRTAPPSASAATSNSPAAATTQPSAPPPAFPNSQPNLGAPELEPAARLLAAFLNARRTRIAAALAVDVLPTGRRLVNGGTHGLARFTDACRTGEKLLGLA